MRNATTPTSGFPRTIRERQPAQRSGCSGLAPLHASTRSLHNPAPIFCQGASSGSHGTTQPPIWNRHKQLQPSARGTCVLVFLRRPGPEAADNCISPKSPPTGCEVWRRLASRDWVWVPPIPPATWCLSRLGSRCCTHPRNRKIPTPSRRLLVAVSNASGCTATSLIPPPSEALDRPRHRQPNILPIRLPLDAFRSAPFRCRCQGSGRPSLHRETGPRPVALLRAASLLQVARCPAHRLPKAKNAGLALPVAIGSLPNRIDCSLRRSRSLVAFCFRCS